MIPRLMRGAAVAGLVFAMGGAVAQVVGRGGPTLGVIAAAVVVSTIFFVLGEGPMGSTEALAAFLAPSLGFVASAFVGTPGFGTTQTLLAVTAVVGPLAVVVAGRLHLGWGWAAVPVVAAVIVVLAVEISDGGVLGHDESALASRALGWMGRGAEFPAVHRGVGMSALAVPIHAAGGSEAALRGLGLLSIVGLVAGTYYLTRQIGSSRSGSIAALVVLGSLPVLHRGSEFLSDVPAAALLVVATWLVVRQVQRGAPSLEMWWLPTVAAAAFYIRYQSALSLVLLAMSLLLFQRHRLALAARQWWMVVGAGAVLVAPHLVYATLVRGAPWGVVTYTASIAGRAFVGEGLVDYAGWLRFELAGLLAPIFLLAAAAALVSGRIIRGEPLSLSYTIGLPAVLQILVLGLVAHGEPRFLVYPITVLVVIGSLVIDDLLRRLPEQWEARLMVALVIALVAAVLPALLAVQRSIDTRQRNNQVIADASMGVRSLTQGAECTVATTYTPQAVYYSGCNSVTLTQIDREDLVKGQLYVLLVEGGKLQPQGSELERLLQRAVGDPLVFETHRREAVAYEVRP